MYFEFIAHITAVIGFSILRRPFFVCGYYYSTALVNNTKQAARRQINKKIVRIGYFGRQSLRFIILKYILVNDIIF
jgi:hypothetical protein